jgi:hypothetical protein
MAEQAKTEKCVAPGVNHNMQFKVAAHGYQCFVCTLCGHAEDVVEDSQP